MLASPHFIFRLEEAPATARTGQSYRINDLDLASRLSFFLWGSGPDEELLAAASRGALATPAGLEQQARRMLADPRATALSTRFAAQWLRLQDLDKIQPDARLYPAFDTTLGAGDDHARPSCFFDSIVREDRERARAAHRRLHVRQRAAGAPLRHPERQRPGVPPRLAGPTRTAAACSAQGSILTLTSVADRTSPVLRGKWVMEVLLGTPPPPPPPNVPDSRRRPRRNDGSRLLSVRERMEEHRANPDVPLVPQGDRSARPRARELRRRRAVAHPDDGSADVDPSGSCTTARRSSGPAGLRAALLKHQDACSAAFTENLMAYALGRRVEYFDMPTVRAHRPRRGANQNSASRRSSSAS